MVDRASTAAMVVAMLLIFLCVSCVFCVACNFCDKEDTPFFFTSFT